MKELASVFEIEDALLQNETFALLVYTDKHEKSSAMLKVFEKLATTITPAECSLWAKCCITSIATSRDSLKLREVPTAWFCRGGCISRIVNLPQAQSYVKEARNVFVDLNVLTPVMDVEATATLFEAGKNAAIEAASKWLAERPLVLLTENANTLDPAVITLNPGVMVERAQALARKLNLDKSTNVLIVKGSIIEPISSTTPLSEQVRELIESNRENAQSNLDERCHRIVNSAPLMIVMKGTRAAPYCKFSKQLLAILEEAKIDQWEYFDIFSDDAVRERLKVLHNWPTYPQIYVDGKLIGGLDTIKSVIEKGGHEGLRKCLIGHT